MKKNNVQPETTIADQIWNKLKDLPMVIFAIPGTVGSTFVQHPGNPNILMLTSKIPAAVSQLEELINKFRVKVNTPAASKQIPVFIFEIDQGYINISLNKEVTKNPKLQDQLKIIMGSSWNAVTDLIAQESNVNV